MRTLLHALVITAVCSGVVKAEAPRVNTFNYILVPVLAVANLATINSPPPTQPHWQGGILFDDATRDLLRGRTKSSRETAGLIGNVLLFGTMAYPFVIDAFADVWLSKKDSGAALRMSLVAAQAFLTTAILREVSTLVVGRERPFQRECGADPNYDNDCNQPSSRTSFFSGHAALSFTGAGLICSARESMSLAGGSIPCYTALGLATVVSVSRVVADKHYVSDTLVGAMVGLTSGYVIPKFLHYGKTDIVAVPTASADRVGLTVGLRW